MNISHESDTPEEPRRSPKGLYEIHRRHMSRSLGGRKDIGPWGGGHPFDVELARIPPDKIGYPLHSHAAQTEYYIIIGGSGLLRTGHEPDVAIKAGDHFICEPDTPHQIINDSSEDLIYYVIADQPRAEITTYPNSGKRGLKPEGRYLRPEDVDYYEGEE